MDLPDPEPLTQVAVQARQRVRRYRTLGCASILVPLGITLVFLAWFYSRKKLGIDIPESIGGFLCVLVSFLQLLASPIAFIVFFLKAKHAKESALEHEEAAKEAALTEEQMWQREEQSLQASFRYSKWLPYAQIGGGILTLAFLGLTAYGIASGELHFEFLIYVAPLPITLFFLLAAWLRRRSGELFRQAQFVKVSSSLGFRYVHHPVLAQVTDLAALPIFGSGSARSGFGTHMIVGELAGRHVRVLRLTTSRVELDSIQFIRQTVAITKLRRPCPTFRIWCADGHELKSPSLSRVAPKLGKIVGRSDPALDFLQPGMREVSPDDFVDQNEIEGDYRVFVRPEDRESLVPCLHSKVFQFLDEHPGLIIESANQLLAFYSPGHPWEAENSPQRIAELLALAELLEQSRPVT
jgi:hypothetical protein